MAKINWPKWALLAGAIAAWLTWCGWGGGWDTCEKPSINWVPSNFSIFEKEVKSIQNLTCNGVLTIIKDQNSSLNVSYDEANSRLDINASLYDLADWVNKVEDIILSCSNSCGETNTTLPVTIQDAINDALLSYTTNIPTEVLYNWTLTGSITLSDSDGLSSTSYTFDLVDSNWNVVYTWVMEDNNWNWTYDFNIDLSALNLSVGTYTFQTEAIDPIVWWENPQDPIVITHTVQLKWVLTLDWPTSWDDGSSYEINLGIDWYDINDLTFRVRWSYDENWDWQDYDEEISLWWTAIWWNVALSNNWIFTIDTTNTWYWDGTSMWSWDWVEIEVKAPDWTTVIHRFTVN